MRKLNLSSTALWLQTKHIHFFTSVFLQGTQGTGKTGKMAKKNPYHKVKDIATVAAKKINFLFQKLDRSAKLVLCM